MFIVYFMKKDNRGGARKGSVIKKKYPKVTDRQKNVYNALDKAYIKLSEQFHVILKERDELKAQNDKLNTENEILKNRYL